MSIDILNPFFKIFLLSSFSLLWTFPLYTRYWTPRVSHPHFSIVGYFKLSNHAMCIQAGSCVFLALSPALSLLLHFIFSRSSPVETPFASLLSLSLYFANLFLFSFPGFPLALPLLPHCPPHFFLPSLPSPTSLFIQFAPSVFAISLSFLFFAFTLPPLLLLVFICPR